MKINIFLVFILTFLASCEEMNELHQKYLDEGEIIYIGKTDSVTVRNGFGRILLQWELNADPKISTTTIYWNFGKDSLLLPVKTEERTPSILIDLEQGKYNFELINRDMAGNKSLTTQISGTSYGEEYRKTLYNRPFSINNITENELTITWGNIEGCIGAYLEYINRNGNKRKLQTGPETTTVLNDFTFGGKFTCASLYIPEEGALDTIPSVTREYNFPDYFILSKEEWTAWNNIHKYPAPDRSSWSIDYASTQESVHDGPAIAENILDDLPGTFWHSQWDGDGRNPPLPHTIIVDMQGIRQITSLELARRTGNKDTKDVNIEISADKENWENAGVFKFPNNVNPNSKVLVYPTPLSGRYLKIIITASNNAPQASLSGIYLTGVK